MKGSRQNFQKEFLILIAILIGAGLLRFYSLGHPFYHTDEAAQLLSSLRLYQTTPFQFSPLASNFFAQIFSYQYGFASVTLPFFFYWILSTLGIPLREWVLILPSTLSGMAAIVMVYALGPALFIRGGPFGGGPPGRSPRGGDPLANRSLDELRDRRPGPHRPRLCPLL